MSIRVQAVRSLLIGAAALAIATPAWAQTQEEAQAQAANEAAEAQPAPEPESEVIIVTATKRASTVQDVPFSINAQSQEDIQRANASTIEDISRNVAGLTVQNLGPGQSQVSVRGVSAGQIARDQPGVKEQVGIYLDETITSLSLFTPDFDLFDLNRVETLRGPQGTLFGAGSVGGTLRYITNQPRLGRTEGSAEFNMNHVHDGGVGGHVKGALNLPVGETAAIRGVAYATKYAGFIDAEGPAAGEDVNDGSRVGGRISMLWQPVEELRITPRVAYQKVEADGFNREDRFIIFDNENTTTGGELIGKRKQYLLFREKFHDKTFLSDLVASYDFGPAELTSVTSYVHRDILVSRDASALTDSIIRTNLPSNLRDTTKLKQFTQELRVASTGTGPFQWIFGGFYSKVDRKYEQRLPTPGADAILGPDFGDFIIEDNPYHADLPYDIKQKALFGEVNYDFGQFKLTVGGRYYKFNEERDFISGGLFSDHIISLGDKTKSSGFSPRFIATYEPNRNLSFNVQAAKGFRLGGINDPLNVPLCEPEDLEAFSGQGAYDDETLWNYEAGVKYSKNNITFNSAVFHNEIRDLQVTATAGSCSSRLVFNVPKAHSTGIEAELSINPIQGLDLSVNGSVQKAKFDSTVTTPAGNIIAGIEEGNRLPTVPKFQIAAAATYGQPLNDSMDWSVTGSVQHIGNRYGEPGDQVDGAGFVGNAIFFDPATGATGQFVNDIGSLRLPAYTLANVSASLAWTNGLEVSLYVKNLFDESPKLSIDRERGLRARFGYLIGSPRQVGMTTRFKF